MAAEAAAALEQPPPNEHDLVGPLVDSLLAQMSSQANGSDLFDGAVALQQQIMLMQALHQMLSANGHSIEAQSPFKAEPTAIT